MKEIFLGKPTAKQLEWMRAHVPIPQEYTVVKFTEESGKPIWYKILPLNRAGCENIFCDADLETAGLFETAGRGEISEIRIQNGAVGIGGPFGDDYSSLKTVTAPATVAEIDEGAFLGCLLERLVFKGKT